MCWGAAHRSRVQSKKRWAALSYSVSARLPFTTLKGRAGGRAASAGVRPPDHPAASQPTRATKLSPSEP
jgi:hypothetical protein